MPRAIMHHDMSDTSLTGTPILVLDSYPEMREAIREALESAGYLVITAGDMGAAIDHLSDIEPHLLIIAPYINSMPGHIAADYLRTKHPGLPVLVVAGFMDDDRISVQNAVRQYHTFPPPFAREQFLKEVKDVLKHEAERRK
jgi:two-component system OmpR family response regulator